MLLVLSSMCIKHLYGKSEHNTKMLFKMLHISLTIYMSDGLEIICLCLYWVT